MPHDLAIFLFWCCIAIPLYAYAGYPLELWVWSRLAARPVHRDSELLPTVTVLVPAYNEADWIEAKIRNTLAADYPADKLDLLIASDGSRDGTVEKARQLADGVRVRVLEYGQNSGKVGVLNQSLPEARGEVILFSDASAMLEKDAIRLLMSNFADPEVGGACGRYRVANARAAETGIQEELYWRYETAIKEMESRIDSILGSHGQVHAIRKSLYEFPHSGTVNDDFVIPMRVVRQGYRVVYDTRAVAWEEAVEMSGFGRRIRIMAGNIQQLSEMGRLLLARRWAPLFCMISHKVLRLVVPFAMIGALMLNIFLSGVGPLYQATLGVQAGFYLLALFGAFRPLSPRVLMLPYYFCMVNAAIFAGIYHAVQGRRKMVWK